MANPPSSWSLSRAARLWLSFFAQSCSKRQAEVSKSHGFSYLFSAIVNAVSFDLQPLNVSFSGIALRMGFDTDFLKVWFCDVNVNIIRPKM